MLYLNNKKAGNGFLSTITCLSFLVRPARFEPAKGGFQLVLQPAAYGFEEQDSENRKMLELQTVDSKPIFQLTFGFVWKCLEKFGLDGHNLGTGDHHL